MPASILSALNTQPTPTHLSVVLAPNIVNFTILSILALVVVAAYFLWWGKCRNHIKGPRVGDDLYKEVLDNRHHGMISVHEKYGEVASFPTPSGTVIFMRGNSELERVFTDTKFFAKNTDTWSAAGSVSDVNNLIQPMYKGSLFETTGKEHNENRKTINPFFAHPEIVRATIKAFEEYTNRWGEEFSGDVLDDFHSIVKFAMVDLLGNYCLTEEDDILLKKVITHFVKKNVDGAGDESAILLTKKDEEMFCEMEAVACRCLEHVKAEMAIKAKEGQSNLHDKGLVYLMLKSGKYSDQAIKELFVNLVVAGGETPALACCKTLAAMAQNPAVLERAVQEVDDAFGADAEVDPSKIDSLDYLDACIMEGLRRYAPATIVGRRVVKETKVCNITIPEGSSLQVSVHAAHMNPAVWDSPEEFNPERFAKGKAIPKGGFVAFGLGGRACPGKRAYMKMAKAILACMLKKYIVAEDPTTKNNLDSFMPNRFVAWPSEGHVTLKMVQRINVHRINKNNESEVDTHFGADFSRHFEPTRRSAFGGNGR